MSKLSRSSYQNFRKQQHRAAGVLDALCELAGVDLAEWPEGRVVETEAYQSAKRLFLAGVAAARSGQKVTAADRKRVSFMLGYKVAGPAVISASVAAEGLSLVPAANSKPKPPYSDPAPEYWRKITDGKTTAWGCIDGDGVKLFVHEGKDWVCKVTERGVPSSKSSLWYRDFWGNSLAGDPKQRATIEDFYFETVCPSLEDGQDEPGPDEHPVVAALWRELVAGIRAAESGTNPEGSSSLAYRVGYEMRRSA